MFKKKKKRRFFFKQFLTVNPICRRPTRDWEIYRNDSSYICVVTGSKMELEAVEYNEHSKRARTSVYPTYCCSCCGFCAAHAAIRADIVLREPLRQPIINNNDNNTDENTQTRAGI